MTRHAPTLFIGLGGSGIQVLRWVKTRILDGRDLEVLDDEPVAFLGIDFDPKSNPDAPGIASLGEMEFKYFDPAAIANAVNNIDRERVPPKDSVSPEDEESGRWEFPEIREWYPDPEQQVIRYAQSEATGAAQWRPLGRIGFFLYDRQIHEAISEALTDLDRKRARSTSFGERPTVIIVSSISGGTGSSILFDVAVAVRKIRRGIAVRGYLLLPETFDHIDFRDRIYPNAYATLWEMANLKNQHVIFHARYPRLPEVTPADSPPPFQRIYLLGPWMGDRRPFLEPRDVYPHFGDLLRLSVTKEIRAAALSAEANASADGGAPLSSSTSRDMFCTVSAMGLRLLTYRELADLAMRRFLAELDPASNRAFLNQLLPLPDRWPTDSLEKEVTDFTTSEDPQFDLRPNFLLEQVETFFDQQLAYKQVWTRKDLEKIAFDLRRLLGLDSAVAATEPPGLARPLRDRIYSKVSERLSDANLEAFRRSPRAFERLLEQLHQRLSVKPPERPRVHPIENLEGLERWLAGGTLWGTLPQLLTRPHLERLRDDVVRWLTERVTEKDRVQWRHQAIRTGALSAISAMVEKERERWAVLDEVVRHATEELTNIGDERDPRHEHLMLDGRLTDVATIMGHELKRLTPQQRRSFTDGVLTCFNGFYAHFSGDRDRERTLKPVSLWIDQMRKLFETELAAIDHRDDSEVRGEYYRLVSPESLFTDDQVKLTLLRCATALFQPGRVQARAAVRLARLLVPGGFRHRNRYHAKLRGWSRAMLGASGSSLQEEGSDETRLVVVLEDLFHPAEDLNGIYDYYTQYAAQPNRLLYHIHREWPKQFAPLITRAGNRGRVSCGNVGCEADIKALDRSALFCPSCGGPIRNRCGNPGCLADDLGTRWNLRQIIDSKTCPACKKFLQTYWWSCPDHGHIPMDKQTCPECVREERDPDRTAKRPDRRRRFTCPVCESRKVPRPFSVTGDAARFLEDGVNGHDQVRAERELGAILNRHAYCPDCGTQLAPLCSEIDPYAPDRPHFLYRHRRNGKADRFRCYLHIDKVLDTCAKCGFPVEPTEPRCRRCETELDDCRFCTPTLHLRVDKAETTGQARRCPHCRLAPSTPFHRKPGEVVDAADDDLFCSNIFACPAGGRLDEATFPPRTRHCLICDSRELPLLLASTRKLHLFKCKFCTELFKLHQPDSDAAKRAQSSSNRETHCCLCGFSFSFIDNLLARAKGAKVQPENGKEPEPNSEEPKPNNGEALEPNDGENKLNNGEEPKPNNGAELNKLFKAFLDIGTALRCFSNDADAYKYLLGDYANAVGDDFVRYLLLFLDRIERPEVRNAATPRIQHLLEIHRSQFGCQSTRKGRGEPCSG